MHERREHLIEELRKAEQARDLLRALSRICLKEGVANLRPT
jgi:hypothetical protein